MQERLLKKISRWERALDTSIEILDVNELTDSIRDDLEKLYNTRKGTVLTDSDFGLQDFGQLFNGYAEPEIENIQKSLLMLTKNYEKRLSSVSIQYNETKNSDNLCFIVSAEFNHNDQDINFTVNVNLFGDGSVTLDMM
ncbi:MAG: type VI secretion system baseplate subunit TssE [Gammaproteobacteria bacterium]|nr:type VI secretion system baseplate subunit TssE [Gammaproteobacteria bacterium]